MRYAVVFLLVIISLNATCQSFYFNEKQTTLSVKTNQTPAHWYIEIYSNSNQDVNLRWKTHFSLIPAAWQIDFDDQTAMHTNIKNGNSSDFVLLTQPTIPQKLIISAHLNDTPGNGTVWMEIYNPQDNNARDTIQYHFIVSKGVSGVETQLQQYSLTIEKGVVQFTDFREVDFMVYDSYGVLLLKKQKSNNLLLDEIPSNKTVFIQIQDAKEYYVLHLMKD